MKKMNRNHQIYTENPDGAHFYIVNTKAFEHVNLVFIKLWVLKNKIMLNFRPAGVYVLGSISKTLHNFSTGFFLMYRGILELENHTSILRKNVLF